MLDNMRWADQEAARLLAKVLSPGASTGSEALEMRQEGSRKRRFVMAITSCDEGPVPQCPRFGELEEESFQCAAAQEPQSMCWPFTPVWPSPCGHRYSCCFGNLFREDTGNRAHIECFVATCEARAMLYLIGHLDLHTAVDGMQRYAEDRGLVAALGQDRVQQVMAAAFETARQILFSEDCAGSTFERAA
jgi:hypothetical protein